MSALIELASRISGIEPDRLWRILRFVVVGTGVNLLMIGAILIMARLGLGYDLALLVTNAVGLLLNYVLNRSFVFSSRDGVVRTALLYAAVYASVYLLQLVLYRWLFGLGLPEALGIFVTVGMTAVYAYLMLEKVVFPQREG
ncbi:MAG: GtrA family protein [Litorimonas sp.]